MAGASDKARFFLEQSVPELKEYERKKIFSPEEISSIARKRSDFEHKINARGSTARDYARYAEFEINVETLRSKRVKRTGVKATTYNGQRRIIFVFDRATKRHSGDISLWMQYIEYARSQKAHKKVTQILTNVLRLHPSRPQLWMYAAQFALEENGDITEARGYIQRGLRFCKSKKEMWLYYARLELSYLARLNARQRILGIRMDSASIRHLEMKNDYINGETILAAISEIDRDSDLHMANGAQEANLPQAASMNSAIPIAIFDAAMLQFESNALLTHEFAGMLAEYSEVPVTREIFLHIRASAVDRHPDHWVTKAMDIQEAAFGVPATSVDFPGAIRKSLTRLKTTRAQHGGAPPFLMWAKTWLGSLLREDDIDPAIQMVIKSTILTLDAE